MTISSLVIVPSLKGHLPALFDLTEHYSSLTMMEQRNKEPLQWKQQRGMAVKEVQTLQHQITVANTEYITSLSSSSVPATVSQPHVAPVLAGGSSSTGILHHLLMWPLSSISLNLALTSQVFFSKYVKQTLLQKVIHCCWFLVTLKSNSFASC